MTRILAIDPGPTESALVRYSSVKERPRDWYKLANEDALEAITQAADGLADVLAIEMVSSYGMPVGREVFRTVLWVGRFMERWLTYRASEPLLIERPDVKLHLCHSRRAKDSNVTHALYDRYGGSRRAAVGVKAGPGPLYGMKADCWQALALAITAAETRLDQEAAA